MEKTTSLEILVKEFSKSAKELENLKQALLVHAAAQEQLEPQLEKLQVEKHLTSLTQRPRRIDTGFAPYAGGKASDKLDANLAGGTGGKRSTAGATDAGASGMAGIAAVGDGQVGRSVGAAGVFAGCGR